MKKKIMALVCAAVLLIGNNGEMMATAAKKPISLSRSKLSMNIYQSKKLTIKKSSKVKIRKKIFSSGNKKIVTVNKAGKITAKKVGKTTIKVKVEYRKKAEKKVRAITLKCKVVVKGLDDKGSEATQPSETSATNQGPSGDDVVSSSAPDVSAFPSVTEPSESQSPDGTAKPSENPSILKEAGLYDENGKLVHTWLELKNNKTIDIKENVLQKADKDISGKLILGEEIEGIEDEAFSGCSNLLDITIPDTVRGIGNSAFADCSNLTCIMIPDNVSQISGGAVFSGCSKLKKISVSSENETYDSRNDCNAIIETESNTLIAGCIATEIPDSVTKIRSEAFIRCTNLMEITIPNGVTEIGASAFMQCSNLNKIVISDSVTDIGFRVFSGCSNLKSISVSSGNKTYDSRNDCNAIIETETNELLYGCMNTEIPDSVTGIGNNAFNENSNLAHLIIPDSIEHIGYYAFDGCSSLTSVTIPPSVISIERSAFGHCDSLTSISVLPENKIFDSRDNCNAVIETESNTLVFGCTNTKIPANVTNIGIRAFSGCNFTDIYIPDSVTSIEDSAFSGCRNLTDIIMSDNVTDIGEYAFASCTSLTDIKIPDGVTSIEYYVFSGCSNLTNVEIPDSVTMICDRPFFGCNLKSIEIPASMVKIGRSAFYESGLTNITIPDTVTHIEDNAFFGCNLTSVTIPDNVVSIGDCVFGKCNRLMKISVSSGNHVYDSRNNCNAIIETKTNNLIAGCMNTVIPNDITCIENYAFSACSALKSIKIPDGVTEIGWKAFINCSNLTNITIPDGVTSIGGYAFSGCVSLDYLKIPDSVTDVGSDICNNVPLVIYDGNNGGIIWDSGAYVVQRSDGTPINSKK